MKPWREVAVPHEDVLGGTLQQSEFAADISAVRAGTAPKEYQDAVAFFDRTFVTEGMRLLLRQVALRLNGNGGDPVIQLQTAFGGGKTHTMLAVYHLATRKGSLQELAGIPSLLDQSGITDIPKAKVAILDGNAVAPGQPWMRDNQPINTMWGELAWQLGGLECYDMIAGADESGTSPGKGRLQELLEKCAPCIILIDELVAYVRQFGEGQTLSGGTYNSNISFAQALTEAVKLVPNAIVLATLPESEVEVGDQRGVAALKALEKTFGRVHALWKPVGTEEAFEIVRRRLFEPVSDEGARDDVCRAFMKLYRKEGVKLPSETQESRYESRLAQAYPVHPEVFDRLYEDWTTLEGFQRTRGVLKLMARVIYRLWQDDNKDLMIMPGSIPLYDSYSRNELTYYLGPGWDPVIEKDVDGDRAEATAFDTRETRFGTAQAARRVGRTIFLGTAPSSVSTKRENRGIDRARVLLGCLQPRQTSSIFGDALNRLADRLHYLNASGDKTDSSTRFWLDTRANLRREMEDRKGRFDDVGEVRGKIFELLTKITSGHTIFDGKHIFTSHGDIPDDSNLRLVILDPTAPFSTQNPQPAGIDAVKDCVRQNGAKPRLKGNRLIFIAPDTSTIGRMTDSVRTALAWKSIVDDVTAHRLNIDRLQEDQAKKELGTAESVAKRAVGDCFRWVLCPVMNSPTEREIKVEYFRLNTAGSTFFTEVERVCVENELVISAWSPIHLRSRLQELYWKDGREFVRAHQVWDDMQKYLFLPRLKSISVLEKTILQGAASEEFFGTAVGSDGDRYVGFKLGNEKVQLDETLLLIEPNAARTFNELILREKKELDTTRGITGADEIEQDGNEIDKDSVDLERIEGEEGEYLGSEKIVGEKTKNSKTRFFGSVDVGPLTAQIDLITVADEVIRLLTEDPNAAVTVTLEIDAKFPDGVPEDIERSVSENVDQLGFKTKGWE